MADGLDETWKSTGKNQELRDIEKHKYLTLAAATIFMSAVFMLAANAIADGMSTGHVKVGIDEKLGQKIPLDLTFMGEDGTPVSLRKVANGSPLIIDMAYYSCPGICDNVLVGLADVLDNVEAIPGKDFNVATISFDPDDNPADAAAKKDQYWGMLRRPFPADNWRFLTGDSETIHRLTDAMGFYFARDEHMKFTHPTALIIVDKNGELIRYIQGENFAPVDLKMALMEAKRGTPEQIISSVLSICFSRDPSSNHLVFNILQVVGLATLVFIAAFVVFLRSTKKGEKRDQNTRSHQEYS
jgi:protein SCO1/2